MSVLFKKKNRMISWEIAVIFPPEKRELKTVKNETFFILKACKRLSVRKFDFTASNNAVLSKRKYQSVLFCPSSHFWFMKTHTFSISYLFEPCYEHAAEEFYMDPISTTPYKTFLYCTIGCFVEYSTKYKSCNLQIYKFQLL